jgi:hypothetical protein
LPQPHAAGVVQELGALPEVGELPLGLVPGGDVARHDLVEILGQLPVLAVEPRRVDRGGGVAPGVLGGHPPRRRDDAAQAGAGLLQGVVEGSLLAGPLLRAGVEAPPRELAHLADGAGHRLGDRDVPLEHALDRARRAGR